MSSPDTTGDPHQVSPEIPDDAEPINSTALLEQCLGNQPFVITLLNEFEKTVRDRIGTIAQHHQNGQLDDVAQIAHALAGVAAILVAGRLSQIASRLQIAAESRQASESARLVNALEIEAHRVLEQIPRIRASLQSNQPVSAPGGEAR